ncbi:MAG: hypothetical protein JRG80_22890, partial [Deltaproteobacteria bacterium]|nr:hypothetical protein [Deltaproteobacteria bacterium]
MNAPVPNRESLGLRGRIETEFGLWGGRVCRHPWLVIGLMAAFTLILAGGAARLRLEMSTDRYLDANDPARVTYDDFRHQFANDD